VGAISGREQAPLVPALHQEEPGATQAMHILTVHSPVLPAYIRPFLKITIRLESTLRGVQNSVLIAKMAFKMAAERHLEFCQKCYLMPKPISVHAPSLCQTVAELLRFEDDCFS